MCIRVGDGALPGLHRDVTLPHLYPSPPAPPRCPASFEQGWDYGWYGGSGDDEEGAYLSSKVGSDEDACLERAKVWHSRCYGKQLHDAFAGPMNHGTGTAEDTADDRVQGREGERGSGGLGIGGEANKMGLKGGGRVLATFTPTGAMRYYPQVALGEMMPPPWFDEHLYCRTCTLECCL